MLSGLEPDALNELTLNLAESESPVANL